MINTELYALKRYIPRGGDMIAILVGMAAAVALDSLLSKRFPDMNRRSKRAISTAVMFIVLTIYFTCIKNERQ